MILPDDTAGEAWAPIEGFPGYSVSNMGRVYSHPRMCVMRKNPKPAPYTGRVMKLTKNRDGYKSAHLRRDGRNHAVKVHGLVCEAFHGARPAGHQAAHLNNKRDDNRADNLVWATPKENTGHQVMHGTRLRGERHGASKVTDEMAQTIRMMRKAKSPVRDVARFAGISESQVYRIASGLSR